MDLSNLSTSLHETESSTSNRRTVHLRSVEDELNAFFRSSALGLTTLYRQGVTAAKSSYDKGYGDALAHVLELWEKDKGWLRGYLQRRIEALDAGDDEEEQVEKPKKQEEQQKQVQLAQRGGGESSRRGGKRSRSDISSMDQESPVSERRGNTMTGSSTSSAGFSSGFSFSTPLTMPFQPHSPTKHTRNTPTNTRTEPPTPAGTGRVIKTSSNPAAQRRRLEKLKGLRSGARDKIIEIKQPHQDDMIQDQDDAWTDDEPTPTTNAELDNDGENAAKKPRRVVWSENAAKSEHGVLERKDRRKRRRTKPTKDAAAQEEELRDSTRESEVVGFTYHS